MIVASIGNVETALTRRIKGYWPLWLVALVGVAALALFLLSRSSSSAPGTAVFDTGPAEAQAAETQASVATITWSELVDALGRSGRGPGGVRPDLDVFLATPQYFSVSGRTPPRAALEEPSLLFFVTEDSHRELDADPPQPLLRIDGGAALAPEAVTVLADSEHHRTVSVRYAALDPAGRPLFAGQIGLLELVFPAPDGEEPLNNVLDWSLPIRYTDAYVSGEVVLLPPTSDIPGTTGPAGSATPALVAEPSLTWPAVLAIMAGMLTALSPCLVQLAFYFTATLGGASTEGVAERGRAAAQRHVVLTGLFFALGFTLVYTAGGAAAGYVGQSLDELGVLTRWMRPISIVAGTVIIFMAIRVAWNARAPLVCKLPMAPVFGRGRRTGPLGSALMGISFAGGCLACFSASILPALLLYAGSTGSVAYGALLLGVFSLGISLPCLALAFGVSRLQPLVQRIQGAGPALGLVSAAVMAAFGFIMLTNQFHIVSGLIGRHIHTVEGLISRYIAL